MKKPFFLLFLILPFLLGCTTGKTTATIGEKVTIYKSSSCGCCTGYAAIMGKSGFNVQTINTQSPITSNIPQNMRSCHTSIIGDYFVEGHVPFEAITKLVAENLKNLRTNL